MANQKNSKKTAETNRIDIFENAFATNGGEPQPATLNGIDFNIRRNFTGAEVANYIEFFNTSKWTPDTVPSPEEQIKRQLDFLTDLSKEDTKNLVEWLLAADIKVASKVCIELGKVAGLRDNDGNFLAGQQR
ncbi:hypothetical protein CBE89_00015 [Corynebacterium striatum]|uniref:Uncharacterized protein n=1 Tax=Corynebacterium striatum TaxID=43770 RepID=A0A2Z2J0H1_CORST|nr:hypothetical protein [Corynebacterium striatum]ART20064.1 hypothetical protein CBE89_00015 [Corynebacterium striatum]